MASKTALVAINAAFEDRVSKLADEGRTLYRSMSDVAGRMIHFGRALSDLWDRAKSLDNDVENGAHRRHLMSKISKALGTDNMTVRSKWLAIGRQSDTLRAHQKFLPPQRDSLYEVALAAKDRRSIAGWINRNKLTPDSSVRDIRSLRKPNAKNVSKAKRRGSKKRHLNAKVTLCFHEYSYAVTLLKELLLTSEAEKFEVESHQAFTEALRSMVGDSDFAKIEKRLR